MEASNLLESMHDIIEARGYKVLFVHSIKLTDLDGEEGAKIERNE